MTNAALVAAARTARRDCQEVRQHRRRRVPPSQEKSLKRRAQAKHASVRSVFLRRLLRSLLAASPAALRLRELLRQG